MVPNPKIIQAVETLGYRVTTGDVASQAGLPVELAEKNLQVLAGETGGIFQVGETGDIVYAFPNNVQAILRNKYFKLRLQEVAKKIWQVAFYLFRMSLGIILVLLILLVVIAIVAAVIAIMSSQKGEGNSDNNRRSDGGGFGLNFFYFPNFFHLFSPDYGHRRYSGDRTRRLDQSQRRSTADSSEKMGFLEVVFSFLFGDSIPNTGLEERRWRAIAQVVRNYKGAVPAEVIAPYLDEVGQGDDYRAESYMMPVLAQFNGKPEFSPENELVYHFPELQATASQQTPRSVPTYLQEELWKFSSAESGQLFLAGGLGVLLFGLSLFLGGLIALGELQSIPFYWMVCAAGLGYSSIYLLTPLVRYFWLKWRNGLIAARNEKRQHRAMVINKPSPRLQRKLAYAQQFAEETVISQDKLVYTTETDLLSQEHDRFFGSDPS